MNIVSSIFIYSGLVIICIAVLGILKFKSVEERQHAIGMIDTLGCALVIIGLIFSDFSVQMILKLIIFIIIWVWMSAPNTYLFIRAKLLHDKKEDKSV